MIVVLSDDFSGAAELAGVALRHGLSAEVQTDFNAGTDAEVVCVDTDSRLRSPAAASRRVADVARQVVAAKPEWIFKKCDSVLRGPVLAEARALLGVTGKKQILLVPANPSRQRTIRHGRYFIADRPLQETTFAQDPVHPILTSEVTKLLGGDLDAVTVPDVQSAADVRALAGDVDSSTLPVGAADFFAALLEASPAPRFRPASSTGWKPGKPMLLVCGSAAAWPLRQQEATAHGIPAFSFPHDVAAIGQALRSHDCVLVGIGGGPETQAIPPAMLASKLAAAVAGILQQAAVDRLLVEGGATSSALVARFGWTRLRADQVAEAGVGVLRPLADSAPMLVVKPGSYSWPAAIWPALKS